MSREITSINQKEGRYTQGGITDKFPSRLGWWERRIIPKDDSDIYHIITKRGEGRPDLISYDVYKDAYYAWFIMQYNSIVDPTEELVKGKRLRLPTPSRLKINIIHRNLNKNVRSRKSS
jgi:hypothetical protein